MRFPIFQKHWHYQIYDLYWLLMMSEMIKFLFELNVLSLMEIGLTFLITTSFLLLLQKIWELSWMIIGSCNTQVNFAYELRKFTHFLNDVITWRIYQFHHLLEGISLISLATVFSHWGINRVPILLICLLTFPDCCCGYVLDSTQITHHSSFAAMVVVTLR